MQYQKGNWPLSVVFSFHAPFESVCLRCGTFDACDLSERIYCVGDFGGFLSLVDADTLQTVHATRAHTDLINSISGGGVGSTEILTGKYM